MLYEIPFTIITLVLYNLFGAGLFGAGGVGVWDAPVFSLHMISGGTLTVTGGALITLLGLFILFIEVLKATRTTAPTIIDHGASMVVFIVYLVEFIVVPYCATSTFLTLMAISLVDVVGGFTITIRGSRRDYAIERDTMN